MESETKAPTAEDRLVAQMQQQLQNAIMQERQRALNMIAAVIAEDTTNRDLTLLYNVVAGSAMSHDDTIDRLFGINNTVAKAA